MGMRLSMKQECPKSKDGIHEISAMPLHDVEGFKIWNALTLEEKIKSQFCVYCGEPIW